MARPGIMLYFDTLEPIRVLPDADKGRLLMAMLEYGKNGTVPEFDGMLALAWGFVKPKLDRDEESYENAKLQRRYAAFCKRRANLNLPKIPFEQWLNMDDNERQRTVTDDNEPERAVDSVDFRYPTTTTTAAATVTPSTTPSTTPSATAAVAATETPEEPDDLAAAAADKKMNVMHGNLGRGVIAMTEAQMDDLLDRLGLDMFDYYVDKLSTFIVKNGARVKNHYETILRWYEEDSRVKNKPGGKPEIPKGASGVLGGAELEAIQRMLREG